MMKAYKRLTASAAALTVALTMAAPCALAAGPEKAAETVKPSYYATRLYSEDEFDALEETQVLKSDESPTGYYVTFRYKDAKATRVRIYGEWRFSDISRASYTTSSNASPEEWQDGYTVYKTDSWPTADMEKNEETGIWSYTIPLPTGTWCYRFYVNYNEDADQAELTDYTDAVMVADPANVNYLAHETTELDGEQALTSVYVPYDPIKQAKTEQRSEEAVRSGENGTVFFVDAVTEDGLETSYGVYLPYEFDQKREEKYPILILLHGNGGYDGSWFSNGTVNILDNMIAEGRLEPTIVVTPNGTDFEWNNADMLAFFVDSLMPYLVENYNASEDPAYRAIGGLSMGGATTGYAMFNYADDFDTFLLFSAPYAPDIEPDLTLTKLQEKNIYIGYGRYDTPTIHHLYSAFPDEDGNMTTVNTSRFAAAYGSTFEYMFSLRDLGVDFTVNGGYPFGHDWVLWRKLLVDVCDNVLWKAAD